MENLNDFKDIIEILNEIKEDETISKNTKSKIDCTMCVLEKKGDVSVIINRTIQELDCLLEDPGLPIYLKTQLWNIVTILESKI